MYYVLLVIVVWMPCYGFPRGGLVGDLCATHATRDHLRSRKNTELLVTTPHTAHATHEPNTTSSLYNTTQLSANSGSLTAQDVYHFFFFKQKTAYEITR